MYTNLKREKRGFTPALTFAQFIVSRFKTFSDFKLLLYFSPNFTREQSSQPKSWCRGFTLIEILVVIGIIGLLTAIMTVSFSEVRKQSRDKSRMVGLKQLELALELYREANGQYPAAGCGAGSGRFSSGRMATTSSVL